MPPIHGSCLCGGVEFEIAGPLMAPLNCHCSQCRKQHGAAFRSRVRVRRRISAGSRASIWSSSMKARAAISAGFAANAARRSSTAMGRTGSRRRTVRKTPRRNTASRWRCSTIRRCGRRCTASSPARRRGSRSPTTCRNIRNIRRCSHPCAAYCRIAIMRSITSSSGVPAGNLITLSGSCSQYPLRCKRYPSIWYLPSFS